MNENTMITGEGILKLLPQRDPIVMIDKFYGIKDGKSYSALTIQPNNLFCDEGVFQETGIIEHIAQSAAARVGYVYTVKGEKVPLGFIGSVDKLKIHNLPLAGEELYTEINIIQEVFEITLISAQVTCGDKPIAECRMKIFLKPEA
ncbi:hydroxymyristoyl-ACP dehydratase [Bacteroides sp. 519]|uniref:hydroxymyristoyl-ACP dehydratase n=1 Tax=Bacteroides sp. 519 TaxID=2302937 RepID=UPI0013D6959D|nr:hydroxymyristoyl-ACP dehydratase [Bacteroides sp. 519]NDV58763.1 hydroxymyristoyl-ACP dehydratase [Bacteroides sp. 519]